MMNDTFSMIFKHRVSVHKATDREKALLAPYPFLNTSFATKKLSFHIIIYLDPIFQATNDFREFAEQKNALFSQLRYFFEKRSHQWEYTCVNCEILM